MASKPLGIGIIGTGFGAKVQLPGFLGLPEVQVIGIASKDEGRSQELAKKHGLARSFRSWEELIACDEVDLVSVATPPPQHEQLVSSAIAAGKHVLCEKPFTMSNEQARNVLNAANTKGVLHAVDFEFRELPAWQLMHRKLSEGSIGTVQRAELRWITGTWADPLQAWRWQCDRAQSGGILGALGVHLFDAAEWLLGPMEKLNATLRTTIKERPDQQGGMKAVTAEDYADIELIAVSGLPVRVTVTNTDPKGDGLSMRVKGELGTLILDSVSTEYGRGLRVREGQGDKESNTIFTEEDPPTGIDARIPPFQSLASRLIHAIQEHDTSFRPSFVEGLRSQMIRQATFRSQESQSWVDIDE